MNVFWSVLFGVLLFGVALFLILLVLVQRGRGGGLSGALGGMGGQSAFGTKAGDLFTRVTIMVATVWILLCLAAILVMNPQSSRGRDGASNSGEGTEFMTRSSQSATTTDTSAGQPTTTAPAPAPEGHTAPADAAAPNTGPGAAAPQAAPETPAGAPQ